MPEFAELPVGDSPKKSSKRIQRAVWSLLLIGLVAFTARHFLASKSHQVETANAQADIPVQTPSVMNPTVFGTGDWKPDFSKAASDSAVPFTLFAKSALVMNLDTDQVYYAKNPTMRLPMASLTKEMTALLTYERTQPTDLFSVSSFAANVGENTIGATAGEKYTVDELLHGLFMQSGNDAAEILAEGIGHDSATFTQIMNEQAKKLGMMDTNYTDPYGLTSQGQYTTAQDLAIITKYFTTHYPQSLTITKLLTYTLPQNQYHKEVDLVGQIDLIRTYPGAIGFKTGFTDEAGYCIVTIAENQGVRLMAIVLGSTDRKADAVKMLDYAYGKEGITIKHQPFW